MARTKQTLETKNAKRLQIVQYAIGVFADRGYHATTMQEVADSANVGKGTLYEYFATKDELFLAVYDVWMDEYESNMQKAFDNHLDPVSKADALIDTTVEFYEKHAKHASLLLEFWAHALRTKDGLFLERIQTMKKRLSELGAEVTKQMQTLKLFTSVDSDSFAILELGISDGVFLQWLLDGQVYSLREAYKFRQSVIGSGLMMPALRKIVSTKVEKKLKKGFLFSTNS